MPMSDSFLIWLFEVEKPKTWVTPSGRPHQMTEKNLMALVYIGFNLIDKFIYPVAETLL